MWLVIHVANRFIRMCNGPSLKTRSAHILQPPDKGSDQGGRPAQTLPGRPVPGVWTAERQCCVGEEPPPWAGSSSTG
ncbi:hypothetical protein FRAHR75_300072 [Frankia sp. Hr75.2]|nr:hypothetical protein FRAHR75_300072 [Frankia sp. Hr75.2]